LINGIKIEENKASEEEIIVEEEIEVKEEVVEELIEEQAEEDLVLSHENDNWFKRNILNPAIDFFEEKKDVEF